ncbi:MAG: S8 family serine peptidase [Acidobacteria bacterium]|nr:S8 family serine peptidase [Acidobacteriota bacterium]
MVKRFNRIRSNQRTSERLQLEAVMLLMLLLIVIVLYWTGLVSSASSERTDSNGLTHAFAVKIYRSPGDKHKLIVPADKFKRQHELVVSGAAQVLADYGSFQLLQVDNGTLDRLEDEQTIQLGDAFNIIWLRNGPFDSTHGAPEMVEALRQPVVVGPRLHLIQFVGPIKDEWLSALKAGGVQFISYLAQNAYVVWADEAALNSIQELRQEAAFIQWDGPYHPAYKLHPALSSTNLWNGAEVEVAIQLINHPGVDQTVSAIEQLASGTITDPFPVLKYINMRVRIPAEALEQVARMGDVFNIEPWVRPELMDERQGQILAGNINTAGTQPAGPGYLAWLTGKGFGPGNFNFVVDVVDTGLDRGQIGSPNLHPDFFNFNGQSRVAYVRKIAGASAMNSAGNDVAGHGTLNASIIGGFNNSPGAAFVDANGFHFGLGIAPFVQIGASRIFETNGVFTNPMPDFAFLLKSAYANGARISANPWGFSDPRLQGTYTVEAQLFDALVRDVNDSEAGNQEMVIVFPAGNNGPVRGSITPPGTAKNVITVGSAENFRPDGMDACNFASRDADSAQDVVKDSSSGPTSDGRVKPDLVAPGTHIQGAASQDAGFAGAGVCGTPYFPEGQQLYTWSSGTSHAAAAVAGGAALVRQWFLNHLDPPYNGQAPSAAMTKAFLANSARRLTGFNGADTLPSNSQGWGTMDLGLAFDESPRLLFDQGKVFADTGDTFIISGVIIDPTKPFRVTLAWTDAPGPTSGPAFVNDLDLQVTINDQVVFRGNNFNGDVSVPGGIADPRNNVESVFLPAGTPASFTITVTARNLADDGVPGNSDPTDQDFALAVYNGLGGTPGAPILDFNQASADDSTGGNGDGQIDPGESIKLTINLSNGGRANARGIYGSLVSRTNGVTVTRAPSPFPNISIGSTGANIIPFEFRVDPSVPRGSKLDFELFVVALDPSRTFSLKFQLDIRNTTIRTYGASDVPKPVPDVSTIRSTLFVPDRLRVLDLDIQLTIKHTFDGDLSAFLISPSGTRVRLFSQVGARGRDFTNTTFDDEASTPIRAGTPPFTGRFRPEGELGNFDGEVAYGLWTLEVADLNAGDTGQVMSWNVTITSVIPEAITSMFVSSDVPRTIPESLGSQANSVLTVPLSATISNVVVQLSINHKNVGDLQIELIGPDGTKVELASNIGGSGDNFINTIFDDGASTSINVGSAPFTDIYQPRGSLRRFAGKNAAGQWALRIKDVLPNRVTGNLVGWRIYLTHN